MILTRRAFVSSAIATLVTGPAIVRAASLDLGPLVKRPRRINFLKSVEGYPSASIKIENLSGGPVQLVWPDGRPLLGGDMRPGDTMIIGYDNGEVTSTYKRRAMQAFIMPKDLRRWTSA
jgi:hypothetical protein